MATATEEEGHGGGVSVSRGWYNEQLTNLSTVAADMKENKFTDGEDCEIVRRGMQAIFADFTVEHHMQKELNELVQKIQGMTALIDGRQQIMEKLSTQLDFNAAIMRKHIGIPLVKRQIKIVAARKELYKRYYQVTGRNYQDDYREDGTVVMSDLSVSTAHAQDEPADLDDSFASEPVQPARPAQPARPIQPEVVVTSPKKTVQKSKQKKKKAAKKRKAKERKKRKKPTTPGPKKTPRPPQENGSSPNGPSPIARRLSVESVQHDVPRRAKQPASPPSRPLQPTPGRSPLDSPQRQGNRPEEREETEDLSGQPARSTRSNQSKRSEQSRASYADERRAAYSRAGQPTPSPNFVSPRLHHLSRDREERSRSRSSHSRNRSSRRHRSSHSRHRSPRSRSIRSQRHSSQSRRRSHVAQALHGESHTPSARSPDSDKGRADFSDSRAVSRAVSRAGHEEEQTAHEEKKQEEEDDQQWSQLQMQVKSIVQKYGSSSLSSAARQQQSDSSDHAPDLGTTQAVASLRSPSPIQKEEEEPSALLKSLNLV